MSARALLFALVPAWLALGAQAQEPAAGAQFNLVTLAAQAEREIANDLLTATLAAEAEGADPGPLADSVNRSMRRALELAREQRGIKVSSGGYQTYPVYDRNRVARWRVRQELRIESADFAAATALIGRLQASLVLSQMALGVSPEARKAAEHALTAEAIAAFEERARIARDALKAKSFRIRDLQISGGGPIAPRPLAARAMLAEGAPPAVEPGTTRVVVTASGTVQLQ